MVIEADTDALFICLICGYLMSEPALEKNHFPGFRRIFHELPILIAVLGQSWRRGHEFAQARIFEFDVRASLRSVHVVRPADE